MKNKVLPREKKQLGWKCPVCGAGMAPWASTCTNNHNKSGPPTTCPVTPVIPGWFCPYCHVTLYPGQTHFCMH